MEFPSHPELAVKGSWSPERMQKELERLRGLGLEPIPKLNFSAMHDEWLGDYGRMLCTDEYYRVLHLLHASSAKNKVIKDPLTLYEYQKDKKKQIGIKVLRISH